MASPSDSRKLHNFCLWLAARPYLALTLAVVIILGVFITKPFNVDDPLFLWAARQIQAHPGNPYGYYVNWYVHDMAMFDVTKNPPLACYYLAAAALVLGWSETALHLAFLLPAIAAILGTYRLAARFCGRPLLAAGITLFTPVYLVSSTTVMCDTLMLAFWMWATILWVEGLERDSLMKLAVSGVLISLGAVTKYYGVCLIPLLLAYSVLMKRRPGRWLLALLIPVAALVAYQMATQKLYGRGLLSDAGGYVATTKASYGILEKGWSGVMALTFTGGCLAIVAFLSLSLWRKWQLAALAGVAVLLAVTVWLETPIMNAYGEIPGSSPFFVKVQIVIWAVGGVSVLAMAAADVWERRDAPACLLGFWVAGTFVFTAYCNWVVNGRSVLPMAPAVAILLVRRLERKSAGTGNRWPAGLTIGLTVGALLAVLVAQGDCQTAYAVRKSAISVREKYGHSGGTMWFRGHWGFQYYMDAFGAKCYDNHSTVFKEGDYLAIAFNNTNNHPPKEQQAELLEVMSTPGPRWVTTINKDVGAGFYASVLAPLPFAFGNVPPERVIVYRMGPDPKAAKAVGQENGREK